LRQVDIQAFSVEEAVRLALEQLGTTRDKVRVEVLATDPGGEEVLVRVIAPDLPPLPQVQRGVGASVMRGDRAQAQRPERMDRPPRGPLRRPGAERAERVVRGDRRPRPPIPLVEEEMVEDDNIGNRVEGEVLLDSALQAEPLEAGEHATPQDAVAPVAAEILQKILVGMRMRGRIVRREPEEEGEAAFPDDEESVVLNVVGLSERDQSILIGRRGETVDALQFIVNLILGRKVDLWARVIIDVEGYRLRRKLALINLAKRTADQVQTRGQAIPLEAMPAYERRIIHMTLSEHPDVTTESSGMEPERRVVVLPKQE
jgi:spoIIIJ-associated protein